MKQLRHDKIEEVIHRKAAEFIRDEAGKSSLITVTRVELNPSGKDALIYFTTLPESEEDTALKFLDRKTAEFKESLMKGSRIGIVPHLRFKIDYGERNRQRLDELGREV
jgi:ribosome-binding factor A